MREIDNFFNMPFKQLQQSEENEEKILKFMEISGYPLYLLYKNQ